jgi:hypothetical protein
MGTRANDCACTIGFGEDVSNVLTSQNLSHVAKIDRG